MEERLIIKYANRKLYDKRLSCYITMSDLYEFAICKKSFKVISNLTKQDITSEIFSELIKIKTKRKNINELKQIFDSFGE